MNCKENAREITGKARKMLCFPRKPQLHLGGVVWEGSVLTNEHKGQKEDKIK